MAAPVHPKGVTGNRTDPATHAALSIGGTSPVESGVDKNTFPPTRGFISPIDMPAAQIRLAGDEAIILTPGDPVNLPVTCFKAGVLYPISITWINYGSVLLLW